MGIHVRNEMEFDQIICGDCLEKDLIPIKTMSIDMGRKPGFKVSEETKKRISESRKKKIADGVIKGGFQKGNEYCRNFTGKNHSSEWKKERSDAMKLNNPMKIAEVAEKVSITRKQTGIGDGANNPNWKGGCRSYRGPGYGRQRPKVLERDNYTCQRCGLKQEEIDRELDVHHIIPYKLGGTNDLSNLISLCRSCHNILEPNKEKKWQFKSIV